MATCLATQMQNNTVTYIFLAAPPAAEVFQPDPAPTAVTTPVPPTST